jgi:hypothetical protein
VQFDGSANSLSIDDPRPSNNSDTDKIRLG